MNKKGNAYGIVLFFIFVVAICVTVFWVWSDSTKKADEMAKNPRALLDKAITKALEICKGQTFCEIRWGLDIEGLYYTQTDFINAMNEEGYEFQSAGGRFSDYLYFKKK